MKVADLLEVKLADMTPDERKAARKKRQDAELRAWSKKREAKRLAMTAPQPKSDNPPIKNHEFGYLGGSSTTVGSGRGTGKLS